MRGEDLRHMVREAVAASGDEDAAKEAREEQAREDEADLLLLTVRERRGSLTEEERARAQRLRGDA